MYAEGESLFVGSEESWFFGEDSDLDSSVNDLNSIFNVHMKSEAVVCFKAELELCTFFVVNIKELRDVHSDKLVHSVGFNFEGEIAGNDSFHNVFYC